MTVVSLCMEIGAFGEPFADELAAALGIRLLDLQPVDVSIAEVHAFNAGWPRCAKQPSPVIDDLTIRVTSAALEAADAGDVLIVGWSAAAVLAPLRNVTRVCARAPRPRGAWRTVRRVGYDSVAAAPASAEPSEQFPFRIMRGASNPNWWAPDFDLVVEAGLLSAHDCQREIVECVTRRGSGKKTATRADLEQLRVFLGNAEGSVLDWRSLRSCAVSMAGENVPLAGVDSQEAAIARVERHLHGSHETSTPANPLCRKALD